MLLPHHFQIVAFSAVQADQPLHIAVQFMNLFRVIPRPLVQIVNILRND